MYCHVYLKLYLSQWIEKSLFFCLLHSWGGSPRKGSFSEWKDIFPWHATLFQDCKWILVDKDTQVPFVTLENTLVKSQLRIYCAQRAGETLRRHSISSPVNYGKYLQLFIVSMPEKNIDFFYRQGPQEMGG